MCKVLDRINTPKDLKVLSRNELIQLCGEIRQQMLFRLSATGGHVGSNLAIIEATVALHYVFDSPVDKIIFDVSHQCYAHKLLTGRKAAYTNPAQFSSVSGFTDPAESEHDIFSIGHTSTAISLACGLAKGRDVGQKTGVRHNTEANYNFVINVIKKKPFGAKRIDKVKLSDVKEWLIKRQKTDGRGYSSIHTIRGVVRPAFQMAVDDDLIRKNPFEFQLATVVVNNSVTREAITRKQERAFLEFVKNDKHFCRYYDGIYILFKTGFRIPEFVGLTKSDIEFENHRIKVDHQLQRKRKWNIS